MTLAVGIPLVWTRLYQYLKENRHDLSRLHTLFVGGAAAPRTLIEAARARLWDQRRSRLGHDRDLPVGTISRLKSAMTDWPEAERLQVQVKQGVPIVTFETRILDENGQDLPWDGQHVGELVVRGPWVASAYFENPGADAAFTEDGWFRTGDMASMDEQGYMQITDRKKDLIKLQGRMDFERRHGERGPRPSRGPRSGRGRGGPTKRATSCRSFSSSRNEPASPVEIDDLLALLGRRIRPLATSQTGGRSPRGHPPQNQRGQARQEGPPPPATDVQLRSRLKSPDLPLVSPPLRPAVGARADPSLESHNHPYRIS